MKNKRIKMGLIVGIAILFIISNIIPIVIGYKVETTQYDSELDKQLDNLRFMCTTPSGFNEQKYNYYKEELLRGYSSEWIKNNTVFELEKEEMIIPMDLPLASMIGGPKDTPWPMKCHDNHHTSQSPYSTANVDGLEKWRFHTTAWIEGGAAIDSDGTIYFGNMGSDRSLYALYPDGTLKWKYETGGLIWGVPAIAEDGTIYIGSWDWVLHAVNSNGTRKWRFGAGASISSSPAIGEDGTIYFGTLGDFGYNSKIYAVNPNGTEKWHYTINNRIYSDPTIGDDGTIYIGSNDRYLYAINPNGTLKWRFKTGTEVGGSASIADDGTIYAYGTWDNYLYALYPNNGTIKWKCNIMVNSNPSIGSDGTIYIGGDGKLYAVYPNGTRKWIFNLGNERWVAGSCPAISADGTVYIGTNIGIASPAGGEIIAVNSDGTERWRKKIASDNWVDSSPSIGEDGTVYIGSSDCMGRGYLHAFGPQETNEPPGIPTITGPLKGKAGVEQWYKFKSVDPDNNPVSHYIEWDDGTHTGWTDDYASGEQVKVSHTWSEQGEYTIRCKSKDTFGAESGWGELRVIMPRNRATSNVLFLRFLEQFPILQKIFTFMII